MQGELDELEREEFFRLKKVQGKKKRDADLKEMVCLTPLLSPHRRVPPASSVSRNLRIADEVTWPFEMRRILICSCLPDTGQSLGWGEGRHRHGRG